MNIAQVFAIKEGGGGGGVGRRYGLFCVSRHIFKQNTVKQKL